MMRTTPRQPVAAAVPANASRFSLAIVACALACGPTVAGARQATASRLASPAVGMACPSADLAKFFEAFSARMSLQQAFTRFPLRIRSMGRQRVRLVKAGDAVYPLVQDMDLARKAGRVLSVIPQGRGKALVRVAKPDTDDQTDYHFRRTPGCWQMTEIEEAGL